ncbi:MAG: isochorismate synthase [Cyclobacteriaceae bacterium]|nr:isochorismate synthase [Cyclobacteriaceae bacterium]
MNEELIQETVSSQTRIISQSNLFKSIRQRGFACAFYRLPQHTNSNIIIDTKGARNLEKLTVEDGEEGFVFHPFSSQSHDIKFLRKDIHFVTDTKNERMKLIRSVLPESEIWERLQWVNEEKSSESHHQATAKQAEDSHEKSRFVNLVNHAIENIRDGKLQKVIAARKKNISLKADFDPVLLFQHLCRMNENSFVYLTYIPGVGVWCGATPEALMEKDRDDFFKTVALAATQEKLPDIAISEVSWTQKDIEEQALVSRYVINCFKKIRLREFEEVGPRSYSIGNLIHLKTDFVVDMNLVQYPNLCSEMLELLHPTSAVCGMPKEEAMQFIIDNEGFDREYYSGYLGPVNIMEESHIFVNLRCMKLANSHAELFAGAGILSNSQPEKEWHETEIKMDTVLSFLNKD